MPRIKITGLPRAQFGIPVTTTTTAAPALIAPTMVSTMTPAPMDISNRLSGTTNNISGALNPLAGQAITPAARPAGENEVFNPKLQVQNKGNVTKGNTSTLPIYKGEKPGEWKTGKKVPSKRCPEGYYEDKFGYCVPSKTNIESINDLTQLGLVAGNAVARVFENKTAKDEAEATMRRKSWNTGVKPGGLMAYGKTQLNEGIEFPNMMAPPNEGQFLGSYFGRSMGQLGGSFPSTPSGPVKIKIVGEPDTEQMKYGGQSNYGFDSGWKRSFTEMNKTSSDHYKNTMSEDTTSDEEPVLEAEGGETIYKPGDQQFFRLEGPKHTNGGIELTQEQVSSKKKDVPSFIYSDTKALKIKDKNILDHFGAKFKKGGITPAEISKKYDINQFKAILQDPDTDELAKATAQLMIDKNEKRLAELAIVQESMKGLEAPKFAQDTLKRGSAKFGGFMPTYANGGPTGVGSYSDTYSELKTRLLAPENDALRKTVYEKYKTEHPKTTITQDDYINNLLKFQEQIYALQNKYKNDPKKLEESDWNKSDNRRYIKEMKELGYDPLKQDEIKMFQSGFRNLEDAMHDPTFFETFGKYFKTNPIGLKRKSGQHVYKGKPISEEDAIVGPTTNRQFFQLAEKVKQPIPPPSTTTTTIPPQTEPRYMCYPDGKGGGDVRPLPAGMTGGYASADEAAKHCGEKPKKTPFDYLAPDKVNMFAHAAVFPRQIFPYIPDMAYNTRPLALEDWRAKAAQRFSTQYAAPSAQLAQFGPTQGLGANLSFLAGQTGQQMGAEDIAATTSRNIDRANLYGTAEIQRQDALDQLNLQNKAERWKGYATTLQNYDNAVRQYLKEGSDSFTRAWKNRMHLGEINDTNPNFFMSPLSGRQTWKGNAFYTGAGGAGGDNDDLGKMYNLYYKKFIDDMQSDIPDETERKKAARELALTALKADRYQETTDPYRNRSSRRTSGFDFDS